MENTQNTVHNVLIIGGGPAGLSAAIYNARASLSPVVFAGSPPGGQLTLTSEVENFPGYDHILGAELIQKIRGQAEKFGTIFHDENVLNVDFSKHPFEVTTISSKHHAKSIIIATGAKAIWLNLESEQRLRGKGVSACATCDGFFFKNKVVAVVGGGDTALEEALTLTKFASKVYVLHRRDSFRASKIMQERVLSHPNIEVMWNTAVTEVLGQMKVEGIKLKTGETESILEVSGLFLAIGHTPDTAVFKDHIELDEKGYIITTQREAMELMKNGGDSKKSMFDVTYQSATTVPGIFAAGDCVDYIYRQAATAAGMGVAAALEAEKWLELSHS